MRPTSARLAGGILQFATVQPETAADGDDRGSIIEAAYTCLAEPHSGAIPVAAILQRAGVSTRAFYRHFESKDELFLAMLREETDALAHGSTASAQTSRAVLPSSSGNGSSECSD